MRQAPHNLQDLQKQRGVVLLVSMVLLIMITLFTLTTAKLSKGNLQVVGNMQSRKQTQTAAQETIENVISSTQFTSTPTNAIPAPCGAANTQCVSVNGSGNNDITVTVTPSCVSTRIIPNNDPKLDWNNPNDAGCLIGSNQNFGVTGAATNNSLCANTLWDVQATAVDNTNNAQYTINQGTAVRVPATTTCP